MAKKQIRAYWLLHVKGGPDSKSVYVIREKEGSFNVAMLMVRDFIIQGVQSHPKLRKSSKAASTLLQEAEQDLDEMGAHHCTQLGIRFWMETASNLEDSLEHGR